MKAMVLAAGTGTRLRPLTDKCPKCMMPLAGKPLIDWQLRWLQLNGITSCMINLHYFPDMVRNYAGDGLRYGMDIHYSYESVLLGTAGAVKKVADFFREEPFYVIYSDNFSLWELRKLKQSYDAILSANSNIGTGEAAIIAVHWREDVASSGVVEISVGNQIVRYTEKPQKGSVAGNYVNAGFYYLNPDVFDYIPDGQFFDFSYNVFPLMIKDGKRLYAAKMDMPIIGIDTPDAYSKAGKLAEKYMIESKKEKSGLCGL